MTTSDFCIKWGAYALAVLPVWFLELFVLGRIPFAGTGPMLLPLAAIAVAVLELMDKQIHDTDYLTQTYDIPVLAVIPDLLSAGDTDDYCRGSGR